MSSLNSHHWRAIYVKSRSEKLVAQRLLNKGIDVYCPLQTKIKQWSDRRKKITEPLFRSYVFVRHSEAQALEVLMTSGVVGIVKWLGKPAEIQNKEIDSIREFLQNYENIELKSFDNYHQGDEVHIEYGPMAGNFGMVVRQSKHKVVLYIEQLGLALRAEVPKSHLVPLL